MYQINNQKFGEFVSGLRKAQNMTQKELAERLFVSDKTVSKWERGLSLPNVSLLIPIADVLGVTVTELLKGERIAEEQPLDMREVEGLVTCSVDLSVQEQEKRQADKKKWLAAYICSAVMTAAEIAFLLSSGIQIAEIKDSVLLVCGLMLLFGSWFCLLAKETLPTYYDKNKINYISDGIFRMDIPGVRFNNSNWPHVLNVCRIWTLALAVLFPIFYYLTVKVTGSQDLFFYDIFIVAVVLCIFVPVIITAKKYE